MQLNAINTADGNAMLALRKSHLYFPYFILWQYIFAANVNAINAHYIQFLKYVFMKLTIYLACNCSKSQVLSCLKTAAHIYNSQYLNTKRNNVLYLNQPKILYPSNCTLFQTYTSFVTISDCLSHSAFNSKVLLLEILRYFLT